METSALLTFVLEWELYTSHPGAHPALTLQILGFAHLYNRVANSF